MDKQLTSFLFPRDVLSPSRPDAHFEGEAEAAKASGHTIQLIDHDAIVGGDLAAGLRGVVAAEAPLIYRGWMIRPERYREMASELGNRGAVLRTSADAFQKAHHLPQWFDEVSDLTPASVWTTSPDLAEFEQSLSKLPDGAAVIKDYSKSEKHYWGEAMFIPDVRDVPRARAVAARFLELRAEYFDEGFVLRQFEELSKIESRTWWVNGECVAITAHPDKPNEQLDEVDASELSRHVESLELAFISIDVTRSVVSSELRIVEIGDGQVSDRPSTADPERFISAIG